MSETFRLAVPPEWDLSEPLIELDDGIAIPERSRVKFLWDDHLVTFHLLAGHSNDGEDPVLVQQLDVRHQNAPGVQSQAFRRLPFKEMRAAAIERCLLTPSAAAAPAPVARNAFGTRRVALTPRHLAEVAKVYVEAFDSGVSTTRAVAENGPYKCSKDTAVKWIWTARREGMLTTTSPGQRGGELTPKAIEILKERSDHGH